MVKVAGCLQPIAPKGEARVTGGAHAGTTYYNGNDSKGLSYEKTIKANGVTEYKHYISLPGSNGQWLLGQFVQRSGNLAAAFSMGRDAVSSVKLGAMIAKFAPISKIAGNAWAGIADFAKSVKTRLFAVADTIAPALRVSNKIDLVSPPNTYPDYSRGAGAVEGPLPQGYTTVSRWVSPEEASLWVKNQGTFIPATIPRNGTPQLYVTEAGAPFPPGANGTVLIDFTVPNTMLKTVNSPNNFMILQPSSSTPIYNVNIHVPNGVTLPKTR